MNQGNATDILWVNDRVSSFRPTSPVPSARSLDTTKSQSIRNPTSRVLQHLEGHMETSG
ncbi:hypothetical protein M413DRAFT_448975 [Hebeloma cylindrosporum]|uniref:Uncharacterized protein n=1 Tax=Hebeloma cylindrosporum TaxID=76867 RepID=A0A0C2Y6H4_HEBCY|nr:hypothetical protein M413DRAFT_448975 [Hebeloma cylindrosporum h7]